MSVQDLKLNYTSESPKRRKDNIFSCLYGQDGIYQQVKGKVGVQEILMRETRLVKHGQRAR